MRRICSLLLALLLFTGLLTACSGHNLPSLSESKKQKIDEAWNAKYNAHIQWNDPAPHAHVGVRYYGTYDGYDILFEDGPLDAVSTIQIGSSYFHHPSSFSLCAYKDGEIRSLRAVYDDGLISDESIAKAADVHREYSLLIYSYSDYFVSEFDWN